jgi:hypothetical protein
MGALMDALQPFVWGKGGKALSPEKVAALRKIAEAAAGGTTPTTFGGGLSALGADIGGIIAGRRADAGEDAGMNTAKGVYEALLGGTTTPEAALGDPWLAADPGMSAVAQAQIEQQMNLDTLAAKGTGADQPASVEEYIFYADQEKAAGREPVSFSDWQAAKQGGMSISTNPDGTMTFTQGPTKLTEGQSKDLGFLARGQEANRQLEGLETQLTDWGQSQLAPLAPLGLGNYFKTPEFRQAKVAADQFLTVILRKDTGAAVTDHEFELYGPMFLPVPGDDPATIAMKRRMRDVAILAIESGLGTAEAIGEANRLVLEAKPADQLSSGKPTLQPDADGFVQHPTRPNVKIKTLGPAEPVI